jgi:SPP1 gp7 family putative phage head morphogenesis protein
MPPKPKVCRAVHANRGIEARYRRALADRIAEMQGSLEYWITAARRKSPSRIGRLAEYSYDADVSLFMSGGCDGLVARRLAMDASPSQNMRKVLDALAKRWIANFDEWAPKIAEVYVRSAFKATDSAFRQALKDSGWSVDFKMTPAMRDALNASIAENVNLIKSIPEQYLRQVDGVVMRSYALGRDLETMVAELRQLYPVAAKRAELIARDQSNKANAVVNRTRQMELGITDAVWMHSHAGKNPRPDHVAANGKQYKIAAGCLISGKYIQPGEEINCRCTSRAVLPI